MHSLFYLPGSPDRVCCKEVEALERAQVFLSVNDRYNRLAQRKISYMGIALTNNFLNIHHRQFVLAQARTMYLSR
jgi:hypothetical protein